MQYEINVCEDCYVLIANGEVFDAVGNDITGDLLVEIEKWWGTEVEMVPFGEEGHFSWSRCDACHSDLGGDRYEVHVFDL